MGEIILENDYIALPIDKETVGGKKSKKKRTNKRKSRKTRK